MPIEVHCPNPACAKVHLVKNKYAGMRGKCPACQSWMYIPKTGLSPSVMNYQMPPGFEVEQPSPVRKPARSEPIEEAAPRPDPKRTRSARRVSLPPEDAPEPVAESESAEEPTQAKPTRHFSRFAVLLLVLALLSLGAMIAAPFLPGPTLEATGDFSDIVKPQGIDESRYPLVMGIPAGVAFLVLLALLPALFLRRLGFINLFFIYLATIGSSLLLFHSLEGYMGETNNMAKIQRAIDSRTNEGKAGEATLSLGHQYHALVAGAGGACLFLLVSALVAHKRLWAAMLGFLFLGIFPAVAVAWVFRKQLGIDTELPFDLPTW